VDDALHDALESEISSIRADPAAAVGFGEKAYLPYSTVLGQGLVGTPDLSGAIDGADDRVEALALLHVVGQRADDRVDPVLVGALERPELRATAAYLLGRPGYRGYPDRTRDDARVIAALRQYVSDDAEFSDPFRGSTFQRRDFVLAALVRLLGVERFAGIDPAVAPMVGLGLPDFSDAERTDLTRQLERIS
jgi:hypothetical protein